MAAADNVYMFRSCLCSKSGVGGEPPTRWGGLLLEDEDRGQRDTGVQFETIRAEKINFGRNNFLEVARKRAITAEGVNEFISLSRGYYLADKTERFKRSLTIPDDPEIRAFIAERIKSL
ncbi:MAG: hypothetical protein ACREUP_06075 [Burkholderiales bacterium]